MDGWIDGWMSGWMDRQKAREDGPDILLGQYTTTYCGVYVLKVTNQYQCKITTIFDIILDITQKAYQSEEIWI